MFVAQTWRR